MLSESLIGCIGIRTIRILIQIKYRCTLDIHHNSNESSDGNGDKLGPPNEVYQVGFLPGQIDGTGVVRVGQGSGVHDALGQIKS